MDAKIHYIVESTFWKRKVGNRLDNFLNGVDLINAFVNTSKEFHNSSPIEARKAAFNHYQSIVEML